MGGAINLYMRNGCDIPIVELLSREGFIVTVSSRKLGDGLRTPVYRCVHGSQCIVFTVLPLRPPSVEFTGIQLTARQRDLDVAFWAAEVLQQHGALSHEQYLSTKVA
jgi:hypothetical protein